MMTVLSPEMQRGLTTDCTLENLRSFTNHNHPVHRTGVEVANHHEGTCKAVENVCANFGNLCTFKRDLQ